jgi:hypothetical protein
MHRIELDSERRERGKSEWRMVPRATLGNIVEAGDHAVIQAVARRAVSEGITGPVEVWRGDTLCFAAIPLERWASGKALRGEQPAHLRGKAND